MLELFIGSTFLSNITLTECLGLRIDKKNLLVSLLTSVIMIITGITNYFINSLLVKTNLEILRNIIFIIVIYLVCLLANKLYKLITKEEKDIIVYLVANTVILGFSLLVAVKGYNFVDTLIYTLGSSLGYFLIMTLVYYLNIEFSKRKVLVSFKGYPIMLVSLSIIYMLLKRL